MTRSKVVKERAKKAKETIGTRVVVESMGKAHKPKLSAKKHTPTEPLAQIAEVIAAVEPQQEKKLSADDLPYLVMVDSQGVCYLRVEHKDSHSKFILNTGSKIELVELDEKTIRSRALTPAPAASVTDSAKILSRPVTESVIISPRCKPYLEEILNNKEIIEMATTKKTASKSAKAHTAAAKKAAKTTKTRVALDLDAVVTLKKGPKEDSIKRHKDFLGALKDLKGKATLKALLSAFAKRVKTVQPVEKIWGMHRKALVEGGFVTVGS